MDEADPFAPLPGAQDGGGKPPRPPILPPAGEAFAAILPAPAPLPDAIRHHRLGKPAAVWRYHDAAGALLFAVCRFKTEAGKEVLPFTFGRRQAGGLAMGCPARVAPAIPSGCVGSAASGARGGDGRGEGSGGGGGAVSRACGDHFAERREGGSEGGLVGAARAGCHRLA
ncbi:hypothetical protein ACFQY5_18765 [Paeniroseomonas aquatica]|uniref:hypothetical protein n=1 Tax=Paeniroseomonas aquatica TaxID=373043 RepID=UPI00361D1FC7